ncbi:MAG: aminoacyl-tRNA hydrolase [Phycisphaerales bacterium]|nr:aminoacyl-tRNA hydrolase [Phycisphaerales bacterium]
MSERRAHKPSPTTPAPVSGASEIVLSGGASVEARNLHWSFSRSGGPGGQNVNKVESRATLWIPVTAITGLSLAGQARLRLKASAHLVADDRLQFTADEHRSQRMNKDECLSRLREFVLLSARSPKVRRRTKPTRSSKERRLESKERTSTNKQQRNWQSDD